MGRRHFRESIDISEPSQAASIPPEAPETPQEPPEVAPAPEDHSALLELIDDDQPQYIIENTEPTPAPKKSKKPKRKRQTKKG